MKCDRSESSFQRILVAILCFAIVGGLMILGFYFYNFNGQLGNHEIFAQFGDFLGGVISPFLSFLTIVLLMISIRLQKLELMNVASELKHIESTHRENMNFKHYSYLVDQGGHEESDLNYGLRTFENVINSSFELGGDFGQLSIFDIFFLKEQDLTYALDTIKSNPSINLVGQIMNYEEAISAMDSSLRAIENYFDKLRKLGCPKYRLERQLKEAMEFLRAYHLKVAKPLSKSIIDQELPRLEKVLKNLTSYPEYPVAEIIEA